MNGLSEIIAANAKATRDAQALDPYGVRRMLTSELTPQGVATLATEETLRRARVMIADIAASVPYVLPADLAPLLDKAPGLRDAMRDGADLLINGGGAARRDIAGALRAWLERGPVVEQVTLGGKVKSVRAYE